jgi:hypothetical protein
MAGTVSAAAMAATSVTTQGRPRRRHCPESEYLAYVRGQDIHPGYRNQKIRRYRVFKAAWPQMAGWFAASLAERVGRLPKETHKTASFPVSFHARPYLLFLGLRAMPPSTTRGCSAPSRSASMTPPRRWASTWAPPS